MRALTLVVACCLVLAGCNAGPSPGTGDDTGETLTPAPVPDEGPDVQELPSLPPGVTASGVQNVSALAAAHRNALDNRSYVLRTQRNAVEQTSGSIGRWTLRLRQATVANETVYAERISRQEDWPGGGYRNWDNRSVYADGQVEFTRVEGVNGWNYSRRPIYPDRTPATETGRSIASHLDEGPATVTVVQREGRRLLRIDTRNAPRNADDSSVDRNAGTVLFVTTDGLVYALHTHHMGTTNDTEWVTYSFQFSRVGGVAVDQPSWLSAARSNTSRGRYRATASGGKRQAEPCLSSGRVAFISCQTE